MLRGLCGCLAFQQRGKAVVSSPTKNPPARSILFRQHDRHITCIYNMQDRWHSYIHCTMCHLTTSATQSPLKKHEAKPRSKNQATRPQGPMFTPSLHSVLLKWCKRTDQTQMSKKIGCGFSSWAALMYTVLSFLTIPWLLWT